MPAPVLAMVPQNRSHGAASWSPGPGVDWWFDGASARFKSNWRNRWRSPRREIFFCKWAVPTVGCREARLRQTASAKTIIHQFIEPDGLQILWTTHPGIGLGEEVRPPITRVRLTSSRWLHGAFAFVGVEAGIHRAGLGFSLQHGDAGSSLNDRGETGEFAGCGK